MKRKKKKINKKRLDILRKIMAGADYICIKLPDHLICILIKDQPPTFFDTGEFYSLKVDYKKVKKPVISQLDLDFSKIK